MKDLACTATALRGQLHHYLPLRRLAEALALCDDWSPLQSAVLAREVHTPKAYANMDSLHPEANR